VACVSKTRTGEARITCLALVTTKRRALLWKVSVAATNVSWFGRCQLAGFRDDDFTFRK